MTGRLDTSRRFTGVPLGMGNRQGQREQRHGETNGDRQRHRSVDRDGPRVTRTLCSHFGRSSDGACCLNTDPQDRHTYVDVSSFLTSFLTLSNPHSLQMECLVSMKGTPTLVSTNVKVKDPFFPLLV